MTDQEKLALLIDAQTKEDNYLAMRLMLDVLGYDFKKAFLCLKPCKTSANKVRLEINTIEIRYSVSIYDNPGSPTWGSVERNIFYKGSLIINSFRRYSLSEFDVWGLDDVEAIETFEEIPKDLKSISRKIEKLFLKLR